MQESEREELGREIMTLALQNAPPAEIRARAKEAKGRIWLEYMEMWRIVSLIDQVVSAYAFDPHWTWGLQQEAAQPANIEPTEQPRGSDRSQRVLQIAADIIGRGASTVAARDIASRLHGEGEDTPEKDLATSAGNILSRAKGWKRVKPGVYAPVGVQQQMQ